MYEDVKKHSFVDKFRVDGSKIYYIFENIENKNKKYIYLDTNIYTNIDIKLYYVKNNKYHYTKISKKQLYKFVDFYKKILLDTKHRNESNYNEFSFNDNKRTYKNDYEKNFKTYKINDNRIKKLQKVYDRRLEHLNTLNINDPNKINFENELKVVLKKINDLKNKN